VELWPYEKTFRQAGKRHGSHKNTVVSHTIKSLSDNHHTECAKQKSQRSSGKIRPHKPWGEAPEERGGEGKPGH